MILVNPTIYPALLIRTALDNDRIFASVVIRVTYTLANNQLKVAEDQIWKVSLQPWESPAGKMEEDGPFMRKGVDLFVFGRAWASHKHTRTMRIKLIAPNFVREAVVTGHRTWVRKNLNKLVPSDPMPFSSMSLTMAEAFGGVSMADGLAIPFPDNALGKGFHITEEQALGQQLPNLEEPKHLIQNWNDSPPVCGFGFCPQANSRRIQNGIVCDDKHNIIDFRPQMFNQAFAPMIAPKLIPGDPIKLFGFSPHGPVGLAVPNPPVGVRLSFGEKVIDRAPMVDQVGIEVEAARAFVTWRFPFKYVVREREKRTCLLV